MSSPPTRLPQALGANSPATPLDGFVRVDAMTKRFPGVLALDNVQLEIQRGEIHALVGENGAGKSTLIKLLSGVYRPDSGRIAVRGQEVQIQGPGHAQALGITTIYQEYNLAPDLSPIENIFLGRELRRRVGNYATPLLAEGEMRSRALALWREFGGATGDLNVPVSQLGGLKQRLIEIIKALAFDAGLVIMDEPTAALPDDERHHLLTHMRQVKAGGASVLLVSHRLEEVFAVADRITVYRDGRWVDTFPASASSIDDLIRKMVGREVGSIAAATARPATEPLAANAPIVLRTRGLTRRGVLRDLDLTVRAGEVVGIGGLAGSGRTEFARAIVGADRLDGGEVEVSGQRACFGSPADAAAVGLVMLPEERKSLGIIAGFSVARNITLGALPRVSSVTFVKPAQERSVAQDFIRELRIKTHSASEKIENLSGGNQQKALFARALFAQPKVILIDEPTQGIDVGAKVEVYRLIRGFVANGGSVIVISSELPELIGLSDRIVVMREGAKQGEVTVPVGSADSPAGMDALQHQIMQLATGSTDDNPHAP